MNKTGWRALAGITRERNERGLVIFIDQLKQVFAEIKGLQEYQHHLSEEYVELTKSRLETAASTLRLLVNDTAGLDVANDGQLRQTVLNSCRLMCFPISNYFTSLIEISHIKLPCSCLLLSRGARPARKA